MLQSISFEIYLLDVKFFELVSRNRKYDRFYNNYYLNEMFVFRNDFNDFISMISFNYFMSFHDFMNNGQNQYSRQFWLLHN